MVQLGYLFALGMATVLAGWIAYKAWTNRGTTGARTLVGVALATAVWAGTSIGLTLATAPAAEFRWLQLSYLGIIAAPITFVTLAAEYAGYDQYLTLPIVGPVLALGGLFLGLVWTNPSHHLYWAHVDYAAAVPQGVSTTPAIGFWGFVAFTYTLLVVGSVLFLRYALTAPHLYRSQTLILLGAVAAPWAANIPHALQFMAADYTPVALAVTSAALWGAVFRYRLTDLGPVALRTVFESITTGVYVLDEHDRVVDANTAGKTMLRVRDDVIGRPFRDLLPTDAFRALVRTGPEEPEVVTVESDQLTGTDSAAPRHYEVRVTSIDETSAPSGGHIVVINDVTEQQERQQTLKNQNERLEEFTSVVSHDLRNPLNVAAGNLTLARENGDGDHLERADQALSRMETLIDDLLALAYGGAKITDPEPVDLKAVVADAWATVDTREATLVNRADQTLLADRSRLHQLIENLIRNAIEHGGDTVTIWVGTGDGTFYVADDGPGIPPAERSDVFETGYTTSEDGTGFGLNIVHEIADAHGWDVDIVESAEGGARFNITDVAPVD